MAAYTTTQTGDWDLAATWGGSGPPGDGDTATVDHAVTIDQNTTVGSSPGDSTTVVLALNADLTVAAGVTFTVKGTVVQANNIDADFGAGSTLIFDASGATPTSSTYRWQIGDSHNASAPGRLAFNGTSGSRCAVQSNASGGNGRFDCGDTGSTLLRGGIVQAAYTDFDDIGDATFRCISPYPSDVLCPDVTITHCTFDGCGEIRQQGHAPDGVSIIFDDNNVTNHLGSYSIFFSHYNAALTSGTRSIQRNYLEGPVGFNLNIYTIEDNIMNGQGSTPMSVAAGQVPASCANNLMYKTTTASWNCGFDTLDNYHIVDTATANPHFISGTAKTGGVATTHDGWIFEYTGTSVVGDAITAPSPTVATTVTVQNCIVIPGGGGEQSSTLVSCIGNANATMKVLHNTYCVEGSATGYATGVTVGETYAGHAGLIAELKSNLAWCTTTGDGALIAEEPNDPVDDILTASGADYNCTYNAGGAYSQGGYEVSFATAVYETDYAVNDVNVNPNFVDDTRNSKTWDTSLGGTGTVANMMAEIAKMNLPTWNSAYNPAALHAWVKAGFAPTNASLRDAGHDSVTIGAVAFGADQVVLTNVGKNYVADLMDGTSSAANPYYVAWGTNATAPVATNTTLGTEASESRSSATEDQPVADRNRWVATITADGTKTITEAGLFTASTSGILVIHIGHTGIPVVLNDQIEYTIHFDKA